MVFLFYRLSCRIRGWTDYGKKLKDIQEELRGSLLRLNRTSLSCCKTYEVNSVVKNEIDELYRADEGWGKPGHSDEEHYFAGTASLCGKWALFSSTLRKHPDLVFPACQECKVRLDSEN